MSRENVKKFYELVQEDAVLAQELERLNSEIQLETSDFARLKEIVSENILPLAQERGLEFSADELLEHANAEYMKLDAEELLDISGGVSARGTAIGLASVLFLSLGTGAAINLLSSTPEQTQSISSSAPTEKVAHEAAKSDNKTEAKPAAKKVDVAKNKDDGKKEQKTNSDKQKNLNEILRDKKVALPGEKAPAVKLEEVAKKAVKTEETKDTVKKVSTAKDVKSAQKSADKKVKAAQPAVQAQVGAKQNAAKPAPATVVVNPAAGPAAKGAAAAKVSVAGVKVMFKRAFEHAVQINGNKAYEQKDIHAVATRLLQSFKNSKTGQNESVAIDETKITVTVNGETLNVVDYIKELNDALPKPAVAAPEAKGADTKADVTTKEALQNEANARLDVIKAQIKTNFDAKVAANGGEEFTQEQLKGVVNELIQAEMKAANGDANVSVAPKKAEIQTTAKGKVPGRMWGTSNYTATAPLNVNEYVKKLNDEVLSARLKKDGFDGVTTEKRVKGEFDKFKTGFVEDVLEVFVESGIKNDGTDEQKQERLLKSGQAKAQTLSILNSGKELKMSTTEETSDKKAIQTTVKKTTDGKWAVKVSGMTDKGPVSYYAEVDMDIDAELDRLAEEAKLSYTPFRRSLETAEGQANHLLDTLEYIDSLAEIKTKDGKTLSESSLGKIKEDILHLGAQIKAPAASGAEWTIKGRTGYKDQEGLKKIKAFYDVLAPEKAAMKTEKEITTKLNECVQSEKATIIERLNQEILAKYNADNSTATKKDVNELDQKARRKYTAQVGNDDAAMTRIRTGVQREGKNDNDFKISVKNEGNDIKITVSGNTKNGEVSKTQTVFAAAEAEEHIDNAKLDYTPFGRSTLKGNTATSQAEHLLKTLNQIDSLDEIKTNDLKAIKDDIEHLAKQIDQTDATNLFLKGWLKQGHGISQDGLQKILDFSK